ncbi:MAG: hypothetical protein FJ150_04780 [Euryarchaeota archaeon]|nr:hypothetical protein [Euryarchaeota archaeon]
MVNEVHVLIHPEFVGGTKPSSIFQVPDLNSLNHVKKVKLMHIEKLKDDVIWLKYMVL